jgi:glucose/arabinose dehydrogenase
MGDKQLQPRRNMLLPSETKMYFGFSRSLLAAVLMGLAFFAHASPPPGLILEPIVTGLNRPVAVRHAGDGKGRLFVVEQAGEIHIIINSQGELVETVFLDIVDRVESGSNEQGLLGLAFDPDYKNNGYFYVNYTYNVMGSTDWTRVSRFSVSDGDEDVANEDSESIIIEIAQDFSNHNGGDIHFGPDGYLYIGMGDGGSGGDPNNRAQTLSDSGSEALLGKMLRIDVHGIADEPQGVEKCGEVQNYKIPFQTDNGQLANPWLGDDGVCDEIWTYGWRNPWRWSFDRSTGDMFVGDVGQGSVEEISWQSANHDGRNNYGWNCKEGSSLYLDTCDAEVPLIDPILEYLQATANGCAVTGGYVYRGAINAMQGDYIYSDYCNGYIWFADENEGAWSEVLWLDTDYHPSAFGEDEAGELYLVHIGTLVNFSPVANTGVVYRFKLDVEESLFADGFEGVDTPDP